jgi:hypothetical protein
LEGTNEGRKEEKKANNEGKKEASKQESNKSIKLVQKGRNDGDVAIPYTHRSYITTLLYTH